MERTDGEPDVICHDNNRSICYDCEALESMKEHKPQNNSIDMAAEMGIEILTEEQYRVLQRLGNYDTNKTSW